MGAGLDDGLLDDVVVWFVGASSVGEASPQVVFSVAAPSGPGAADRSANQPALSSRGPTEPLEPTRSGRCSQYDRVMAGVDVGVVLHATPTIGPVLAAVLTVASIASAALVGLALAAFARRRTSPYLFVALAVAALAARSIVGWLGLVGSLSTTTHHTAEHGLDVVMVALVVAAVWYARSVRTTRPT